MYFFRRNGASASSCSCLIVVIDSISAITALMAVFTQLMLLGKPLLCLPNNKGSWLLFWERRHYSFASSGLYFTSSTRPRPLFARFHCNFRKSVWAARGPDWSVQRNRMWGHVIRWVSRLVITTIIKWFSQKRKVETITALQVGMCS